MANELKMNKQESTIQDVLSGYLASQKTSGAATPHVDHDTLAAFTEGTLNERESAPVVSHLVNCNFCRHITAELVRLDLEFAGETISEPVSQASTQPAKISEVLSGILSKMFGTTENTVFAHNEDEKKETVKDVESDKDKDK